MGMTLFIPIAELGRELKKLNIDSTVDEIHINDKDLVQRYQCRKQCFTFLLRIQWNKKMKSPCRLLKIVNR